MSVTGDGAPDDPRAEGAIADALALASIRQALFGNKSEVRLGRYALRGRLGQGGMGTVYRAWDPELDREVAVKVIRTAEATPEAADVARMGLLREARALATLEHPNVVSVFDAGIADNEDGDPELYIVTELVEGAALDHWLEAEPRSVHEIRHVFVDAGRGLIAAHDRGLVHRDFKLGNVLVGQDGRARVCDFGLVRALRDPDPSSKLATAPWDERSGHDSLGPSRTTGIAGTPGYIAPEVIAGGVAGPAADQFAYCVALRRALEMAAGNGREPLPRGLQRAVDRGLADAPRDRWPSMIELVAIVAGERRQWRSAVAVAGVAGLAVAGLAFAQPRAEPSGCHAAQPMAEVWTADARADVETHLRGLGAPAARQVAQRVLVILDDYVDRWGAGYGEACEAVALGTEGDARMQCYRAALRSFRALVSVAGEANAAALPHLVDGAHGLPDLDECAGATTVDREEIPDEWLTRWRDQLAQAQALSMVHRLGEAERMLRGLLNDATEYPDSMVVLEARHALGSVVAKLGRVDEAAPMLEQVYFDAQSAGRRGLANEVAISRLRAAETAGDLPAGREWVRHARSTLAAPDEKTPQRANLLRIESTLECRGGDVDVCFERAEEALRLALEIYDPLDYRIASARNAMAEALANQGRSEEALEEARRALDVGLESFGSEHPFIAVLREGVGARLATVGDWEAAHTQLAEALRLLEQTGDGGLEVSTTEYSLATALHNMKRLDEARGHYEHVLQLRRAAGMAEDHPRVVNTRVALAMVAADQGDLDGAVRTFQSITDAVVASQGVDARVLGILNYQRGMTLERLGRAEDAVAAAREAQRVSRLHFGAQSRFEVLSLLMMARNEADPADGLAHAESAMALLDDVELPAELQSDVHATKASLLESLGRDPGEIEPLFERARELCEPLDRCGPAVERHFAEP